MRLLRRFSPIVAVSVVCAWGLGLAEPAHASEILARNASGVTLAVNAKGEALVSFTEAGRRKNVLAWGAVNALPPTAGRRQVAFKLDYAGGWGKYRSASYARTFRDACRRYDGPKLAWKVVACKAPDGSYWALQRWQRMLPNLGVAPWRAEQAVWELHLSHWTGELPVLEAYTDWVYSKRFHHVFGRYTYRGQPVYGFASTRAGVPLDTFGRNVYMDTLDSAYGSGWKRENSFLAHTGSGAFCYGFYPHEPYAGYPAVGTRPMGHGSRYRITAIGPGVTPSVFWEGEGLPAFDAANAEHFAREVAMNALQRSFAGPTGQCTIG